MQDDDLKPADLKKMAAEVGLTKLTEEHLQQLLRATNAARAHRARLGGSVLGPADEPAHVFSLTLHPSPRGRG